MNFAETASASCMATARFILATTSPLQKLIDPQIEVVHSNCNQSAIEILKNDGWLKEGKLLSLYLDQINAGTAWADQGWKNVSHYYDPVSGQGLRGWPSAIEECNRFFIMARNCISQYHFQKGFFYLGAAVHLVQDMCVPYHARNIIFEGHHRYERWADEHVQNYMVFSGGLYKNKILNAGEWVVDNARASFDLFSLVKDRSIRGYHSATAAMLPLTQRTTAGFFHYFLNQIQILHI